MLAPMQGRVLRATAGFFDVEVEDGAIVRCKLRGKLKKELKKTDLCVIGDLVEFEGTNEGEGQILEIASRRTVFSRRHPGRGGRYREDVLMANLDQLFIVFAFGDPPFHPRMLDRFLVIAEHNEIAPHVVANKLDQEAPAQRAEFAVYESLGYPVHYASATDELGIESLRAAIGGKVSAFAGPSGVGKSSLLNALEPGLALRVGATSEHHTKGRHTTRVATLHPVLGGHVADTPGIRELGVWNLPDEDLDHCFVEFRPYLGQCGFRSCRHQSEPKCAVKAAVESGDIRQDRFESYLRLLEDEERSGFAPR